MLIVVIGGSGSGKSAYAEELLAGMGEKRYYLATMRPDGEESRRRIKRHRDMRRGKGFFTIEQPRRIAGALAKMDAPEESSVLLECLSNLAANEMFSDEDGEACSEEALTAEICGGLWTLAQGVKNLVVVTNNVFEDGIRYEEETMKYLRVLAGVNRRLTERADFVVEVVAGIPVVLRRKEGEEILPREWEEERKCRL